MANVKFEDYCENLNNMPKETQYISKYFVNWRNFMFNLLTILPERNLNKESLANPIIACQLDEIITTLDGLYVLSKNNSFESISCLVRKLLETSTQFIFILQSDSDNKALAYQLKVISFLNESEQTVHIKNLENLLNNNPKITEFKNKIDILKQSNKYYDWYRIYDDNITSFKALYSKIDFQNDSDDIWQLMYGKLSRESHGFWSCKNLDSNNFIQPYRRPFNMNIYIRIVSYIMNLTTNSITKHFNFSDTETKKIFTYCKLQQDICQTISDSLKHFK